MSSSVAQELFHIEYSEYDKVYWLTRRLSGEYYEQQVFSIEDIVHIINSDIYKWVENE